ncbi:MAG TPA: hypothetical protein VK801_18325 [Caulobacteraceae bacterium]|jgi:hypothetical protein|nr:hypothetical protein [Caulobacteraceae bacterium]
MSDRRYASVSAIVAILAVAALVVEPVTASAQATGEGYNQTPAPPPGSDQYPQGAQPQDPGPPPQGANAAPAQGYPPYAQPPGGGAQAYNYQLYRQAYRDWQIRYAQWFRHNCVNQHARNTAVGALIGGGFGAALAAAVAGPWAAGGWALFGGLAGASTGAAIASSVRPAACPVPYASGPGPMYGPPRGWSGGPPPYGYGPPPYRAPGAPAGPPPND